MANKLSKNFLWFSPLIKQKEVLVMKILMMKMLPLKYILVATTVFSGQNIGKIREAEEVESHIRVVQSKQS